MSKRIVLTSIVWLLAASRPAAAQRDQPPITPAASQPASSQPAVNAPASQRMQRQAIDHEGKPASRASPPPRGAHGDDCLRSQDCQRGLRCDGGICVPRQEHPPVLPVKPSPPEGRALQTRRGMMTVSGSLGLEYQTIVRDHNDAISGVKLTFFPRFGLFVGDGFMLDFGLSIGGGFGELYGASPTSVAFTVGLRYFFGGGRLRPYLGINLGPEFLVPDRGSPAMFFDVTVPAGLLVGLNPYVALDLGLAFRAQIDVSGQGYSTLSLPFGLLGVQVFF